MARLTSLPAPLTAGTPENVNDVTTNLEALRAAINSVSSDQINDGAVGLTELTAAIVNSLVPLGAVIDWYPPTSAAAPWDAYVPSGYVICDGRLWSTVVNDMGYTTGNVPNLTGKYTIGAKASLARDTNASHVTATGVQSPPGVGGIIGTAVASAEAASAAHDNQAHQHNVAAHSHEMAHWHGVAAHRHGLSNKSVSVGSGSNSGTVALDTQTQDAASSTGQAFYNGTFYERSRTADDGGQWTTSISGTRYDDIRPPAIGFLKIMKVRSAA